MRGRAPGGGRRPVCEEDGKTDPTRAVGGSGSAGA